MTRGNTILLIFALLSILIIIAGVLFLRSNYLLERLRIVLEQQIEKELHTEASIGRMKGNVLTGLAAEDITIADVDPTATEPIISVREAAIRYKLLYLLRGRFIVDRITLKQPRLNTRIHEDGKTNLARLTESREEGVTLSSRNRLFSWRVAAVRVEDALFSLSAPEHDLQLSIDGVDMSLSGPIDRWEHRGRVSFRDGAVELNGVRKAIEQLQTDFEIRDGFGEVTEFTLKMGKSVIRVRGSVQDFQRFILAGRLESALDLGDASEFWHASQQVEGIANVELEAAGTVEEIAGNLSISLPRGRLSMAEVESLQVQASFGKNGLRVDKLSAEVAEGKLTGWLALAPQDEDIHYEGEIQLQQVSANSWLKMLYQWPSQFEQFGGAMDMRVQYNGFLSDKRTYNFTGDVAWSEPTINGVPLGESKADFRVRGDTLQGQGVLDAGNFEIAGNLGYIEPFAIHHRFDVFHVGRWTQALQLPELAGEAAIDITLSAEPALTRIDFSMPDAILYHVPMGHVDGVGRLVDDTLYLDEVSMAHEGGSAGNLTGTAILTDELTLDLKLKLASLDLEHYIQLSGTAHPIEGSATGKLHISGPVEQLAGSGSFNVTDASAWGLPLDDLVLPIHVSESVFQIPPTGLVTSGQEGKFDLSLSLEEAYTVHVWTQGCALRALREPHEVDWPLDAPVDAEVIAKGQKGSAELSIRAETPTLFFSGELLGSAVVTGHLLPDKRILLEGEGLDDTVTLSVLLGAEPGTQVEQVGIKRTISSPFSLELDFTQALLDPFIASLDQEAFEHFGGWATGRFISSGDLLKPEQIQSRLTVPSLQLHGHQVYQNMETAVLTLVGPVTTIENLQLAMGEEAIPVVSLTGSFSDTDYAVKLEGNTAPAEAALDILGVPPLLHGQGQIVGQWQGSVESPELVVSWSFPEVAFAFDQPVFHRPEFADLVIGLQNTRGEAHLFSTYFDIDAESEVEGNPIQIQGSWPLTNPSDAPTDQAGGIEGQLVLNLDLGDLEFLRTVAARVPDLPVLDELHGQLNGTLELSGNWDAPRLSGSLVGEDIFLRWQDWPQALEDGHFTLEVEAADDIQIQLIDATASVEDAKLSLSLEAHHPDGLLEFSQRPDSWTEAGFQLSFGMDDYGLAHPVTFLMQQSNLPVTGTATGRIDLEGHVLDPKSYEGTLDIHKFEARVGQHTVSVQRPIRMHLSDGQVCFDDFSVLQNGQPFDLTGKMGIFDNRVQLHAQGDQLDLSIISPFVNLPYPLRGLMTFDLQVDGHVDSPKMHATWALRGIGTQAAQLDALVGEATYQDTRLILKRTQISGYGNQVVLFGDLPVDLALKPLPGAQRLLPHAMDLTIEGEDVELGFLASFSSLVKEARGQADLALHIRGTSAQPHLQGYLQIRDGTIQLHQLGMPLTEGTLNMVAEKDSMRFDDVSFRIGAGEFQAQGVFDMDGLVPQYFTGAFRGEHAQLADITRDLLPPIFADRLGGEATYNAELSIDLAGWSQEIRQEGVSLFNPKAIVKYSQGELRFDDVNVTYGRSVIRSMDANPRTPPKDPMRFIFENQALSLVGVHLRDTEHSDFQIRIEDQKVWELNQALHIDLHGWLTEAIIQDFLPADPLIEGEVRYKLAVRGSDREPVIDAEWEFPHLSVNDATINAFEGHARYENRLLSINKRQPIRMTIGRNQMNVTARVPMEIIPVDLSWRLLPEESQVELNGSFPDLGFLPLLHPLITYADGQGEISLTVGGNIHSPKLSGIARLRELQLGMADVGLEFTGVIGDMMVSERQLSLAQLSGQLNQGTFGLRGAVKLSDYRPTELQLNGEMNECTFSQPGIYEFTCSSGPGELRLEGPISQPRFGQSLTIVSGRYEQPWENLVQSWFDRRSEAQNAVLYDVPVLRGLTLDLGIEAPDSLRLDTQGLVDIEARASGRLVGPLSKPVFVGDVYVTEGQFYLMEHEFLLDQEDPGLISNRSEAIFDPTYRIAAEAVIPDVELYDLDGNRVTKDVRTHVSLTGSLLRRSQPVFTTEVLQPEGRQFPVLDNQVFWLLTIGRPGPVDADGTVALSETAPEFLSKGQRYVFSRLGRLIGLQAFEFDLDSDAFEASTILFTKELSPRWLVTYSSSLHEEPRVEVEYQLNRRISISTERDERGQFGVDLKIEHDFD